MTEHTPGPWSCNLDDFGYTYDDPYVTIEGENKSIAYIMVRDRARQKDITNWKANARLIAAAPEMLEALARLEGWATVAAGSEEKAKEYESINVARRVLAKTKGEEG